MSWFGSKFTDAGYIILGQNQEGKPVFFGNPPHHPDYNLNYFRQAYLGHEKAERAGSALTTAHHFSDIKGVEACLNDFSHIFKKLKDKFAKCARGGYANEWANEHPDDLKKESFGVYKVEISLSSIPVSRAAMSAGSKMRAAFMAAGKDGMQALLSAYPEIGKSLPRIADLSETEMDGGILFVDKRLVSDFEAGRTSHRALMKSGYHFDAHCNFSLSFVLDRCAAGEEGALYQMKCRLSPISLRTGRSCGPLVCKLAFS